MFVDVGVVCISTFVRSHGRYEEANNCLRLHDGILTYDGIHPSSRGANNLGQLSGARGCVYLVDGGMDMK